MFILPPGAAGKADTPGATAADLVVKGGFILTRDNKIIAELNPTALFIPASTWKLATAAMALHLLGDNYRFETRFFADNKGRLFIQGRGAPMLTSEEITAMLPRLRRVLTRPVKTIIIDNSAFHLNGPTDGSDQSLNPYDAGLNATAVNFNTVHLRTGRNGVSSAESQTPDLAIMTQAAGHLPPGEYRLPLTGAQAGRYAGQLFAALSGWQGIKIKTGLVPAGLRPVFIHCSRRPLREIIRAMLLYSNNFIANEIFLTCGARLFGWPATWAKGRRTLDIFLSRQVRLPKGSYAVEEGSGLSRHNRITPRAMLTLLRYFRPYADLLPEHKGGRLKSGTLTGVYNYAGYLLTAGQTNPIVIMLNQPRNNRDAILNRLLLLLRSSTKKGGA
ncbi:D-alanyl-D-alanine carboxypeptidase/D-alanyl-D-alanine-endopeptidase [Desulfobacterota bacterium M19]